MSTLLAAAMLAIVTQNQVSLRAAPRDSAPQQAMLWQGEVLDLRDVRGDYLLVYDLKREREGYVRSSQVRLTALAPEEAPDLLAIVRFLRDTPGAEALGISYAAAYLKSIPAGSVSAEPFDAVGSMADQLARRASVAQPKASEATVSAHLEVVSQLGVTMKGFDREGSVQICYDGAMFRRVLALPTADPAQLARAALGLTRHECVDPDLGPTERFEFDQWRADVLDRVPLEGLNPGLRSRVLMRRAGVLASIAFWRARRGMNAQLIAQRSIEDLASVDKTVLDDEGLRDYAQAAVRVGASRLAAQLTAPAGGRLLVRTAAGAPGETCVSLFDARRAQGEPLARRCTFGIVWNVSASSNADGTALTLAVQPLATWRELWVFRQGINGWSVSVLPPSVDETGPGLGYIEAAGWEPSARRLLVVRESTHGEHLRRHFELLNLDTLNTVRQASAPELLSSFNRWQDAIWRSNTVALR
jgi:hypothetical protein